MIQLTVPIIQVCKIHSCCDADECLHGNIGKLVLRYNHFLLVLPLLKQCGAGLMVMDAHIAHKVVSVSNQDTVSLAMWQVWGTS